MFEESSRGGMTSVCGVRTVDFQDILSDTEKQAPSDFEGNSLASLCMRVLREGELRVGERRLPNDFLY